jgi:WD40 repeat protein
MPSAKVSCPSCKARITLKIGEGETIAQCPECHKAFKIKRPVAETTKANSAADLTDSLAAEAAARSESFAPLAPLTAEDEFPSGEMLPPLSDSSNDFAPGGGDSLTPLESLDAPELASLPSGDNEYRLADEPPASLSGSSLEDIDAIAPLTPLEPVTAPRAASSRNLQSPSNSTAEPPDRKRWIIFAAAGGAALLCLALFGVWIMSGDGIDDNDETQNATAGAGATAPDASSTSPTASPDSTPSPNQFGDKPVEWFEGELAVIDRPPEGAKADELSTQSFTPAPAAKAIGPGGTAETPATWEAFPVREAPAPELHPLRNYAAAWNDTHYVAMGEERLPVAIAEHPGRTVYERWWQRFDYKTNQPVSPRFPAGERLVPADSHPPFPQVALSADGERVALTEPQSPGKITIYAKDGAKTAAFAASQDSQAIEWLGWDAPGNLLTLVSGTLACWSVPAVQPAWTFKAEEDAFVTMSRGRDWAAVGSKGAVHLVNLSDGTSRGQLHYQAEMAVVDIAIAPDEQRLAAIYNLTTRQDRKYHLAVWDLKTGQARRLDIGNVGLTEPAPTPEDPNRPTRYRRLYWVGTEHVALQAEPGGLKSHFFQLNGLAPLAFFQSFQRSEYANDPTPVFFGPHETLWAGFVGERGSSYPVTLLSDKVPEHQEALALMSGGGDGKTPIFHLEVDAGSQEVSRRRAEEIARYLVSKGAVIGPGGDTLRLRYGVTDSGETLESENRKDQFPIPRLIAHYQWLDRQGKEIWSEQVHGGRWDPTQTRYRVGQIEQTFEGEVRHYNFKGDMRTAIVQEIIDNDRFSPAPDAFMRLLVSPGLKPDITLPLRLKAAYPTMDELSARPNVVEESQQSAQIGLAAELLIPGQDHRPPQLLYSPDGTTLGVVAVWKQTRCLLRYDRSARQWVKATALTKEYIVPAVASTIDRFAYHDEEYTLVADALDPSRQIAIPQRGSAELKAHQLHLAAGARRLARVVGHHQYPEQPRRVELWHVAERRLGVRHISEGGAVATAFSPDGALFAAADKQLRIWDANTFDLAGAFPLPPQVEIPIVEEKVSRNVAIAGVTFSRDGKTLAAFTANKVGVGELGGSAIHLWRVEGSSGSFTFSGPVSLPWRNHEIMALSLDRQGDRVAILSATNDSRPNHVELYSLARNVPLRRWTKDEIGEPSAVAISPEGDELAIAAPDKILVFDIKTPPEVAVASAAEPILLDELDLPPEAANLSPTPPSPAVLQAAATAAPALAKIRGFVSESPLPDGAGHVQDLSFSENGRTIAVGLADKKFLVYPINGQKPSYEIAYQTPPDLRDDPHSVAEWVISPEHDRAAFNRRDGIFCIFDRRPRSMPTVLNKRPVGERDYHETPVAAFTPDGRLLCFCQTTTTPHKPTRTPRLEAWDLRQGKRVHDIDGFAGDITFLAFAADGSLAVCIDSAIHLLDPAKDFARLGTLQIPEQNESRDPKKSVVAVSADGRMLALSGTRRIPGTSSYLNIVSLWSSVDGLQKLPAGAAPQELSQPGVVRSLVFDASGQRIFSLCDDESIKERWLTITDAQTGHRRAELGPVGFGLDLSSLPHLKGEQDLGAGRLALAPGGQQLALTSGGKILMFDVKTLVGE